MDADAAAWPVGAVVLAAGASSRMGERKALLPWRGVSLAAYVVRELLATPIARVVVVTGDGAAEIEAAVRQVTGSDARLIFVTNDRWADGKSGSVVRGVAAIPPGIHLLIAAIDQPRSALLIRATVEAHLRGRADGRLITIAGHGGRRGHPIVLAPALRDEMLAIDEASAGLRAVVVRHAAAVQTVEVGDPTALLNLNTPEEYATAVALDVGSAR